MQPHVWQASKLPYVPMAAVRTHSAAEAQSYLQAIRSR
jgi:heme exporter protein D